MTSPLLCDAAYLYVSRMELLCDLFLPVVQTQALEKHALGNMPFQIWTDGDHFFRIFTSRCHFGAACYLGFQFSEWFSHA